MRVCIYMCAVGAVPNDQVLLQCGVAYEGLGTHQRSVDLTRTTIGHLIDIGILDDETRNKLGRNVRAWLYDTTECGDHEGVVAVYIDVWGEPQTVCDDECEEEVAL